MGFLPLKKQVIVVKWIRIRRNRRRKELEGRIRMAKKKVFKIVSAVTLSLVCATFVYAMATVKAEDKDSEKIAQNV